MIPPTTNDPHGGNDGHDDQRRKCVCGQWLYWPDDFTAGMCAMCRQNPAWRRKHHGPRRCVCGQPLVSPLHTRCTDCWEREMIASLARAMGEAASEAATHPRHDELMVLPAVGYVVCATCGAYTNGYYSHHVRDPRGKEPDHWLHYCLPCFGALTELQGRAVGKHDQLPALTDWPGERECHVALMSAKRYALCHTDGWLHSEVGDLLRALDVWQDWGGRESVGDALALHWRRRDDGHDLSAA